MQFEEETHVIRMSSNPACYLSKVALGGPSVQNVAAGMTVVHSSVDKMGLALQHTNTIVQLIDDAQSLISSGVVGFHKGTVMSGHLGDIAVLAVTELRVIVTRLGIGGLFRC